MFGLAAERLPLPSTGNLANHLCVSILSDKTALSPTAVSQMDRCYPLLD
jgi:hypothetical protein